MDEMWPMSDIPNGHQEAIFHKNNTIILLCICSGFCKHDGFFFKYDLQVLEPVAPKNILVVISQYGRNLKTCMYWQNPFEIWLASFVFLHVFLTFKV
jgi:hypothetical protein